MSAKKLKKIAVTIGFKADNTPIKKAFYGRSTAQAKNRAERWLESHGTPEKQADILTLGGWAARWLSVYKKPDVTPTAYTTTYEITVRRHILPALGSCVMMDITPMDIKAFYNSVCANMLLLRWMTSARKLLSSSTMSASRRWLPR